MLQNSLKPISGYNIYLERTESVPWERKMVSSRCVVRRKQQAQGSSLAAQPRFAVRVQQLHAACIAPDADALRMFRRDSDAGASK